MIPRTMLANVENVCRDTLVPSPAVSETCMEERTREIEARKKPRDVVKLFVYGDVDQYGGS